MIKKFIFLCLLPLSLLSTEEKAREIQINGIGKISVKADVADVRLGIEVEEKTAQAVEQAIASTMPGLIESLKKGNVDKLETGILEIHPEYTQSSPPEIKGYRGKSIVSFSAPVSVAGKIISNAFSAGANVLDNVAVRPSDATLEQARDVVLKQASLNALREANLVLESLNLKQKEISSITVLPNDFVVPIGRSMEFAAMAYKSRPTVEILEGEQIVKAQVELRITFREK